MGISEDITKNVIQRRVISRDIWDIVFWWGMAIGGVVNCLIATFFQEQIYLLDSFQNSDNELGGFLFAFIVPTFAYIVLAINNTVTVFFGKILHQDINIFKTPGKTKGLLLGIICAFIIQYIILNLAALIF